MSSDVETLQQPLVQARGRVLDYIELMKPELTLLSALSCLCGFYLGSIGTMNVWLFVHTAIGTLLLGGGAGALNQYIERDYDALMKRTERRPLPSGRLSPEEVLLFGIVLTLGGIGELSLMINPLTGFLGAVTFATYIFLYTPLKRITPFSTIVGAIPGALPPMMGWSAARNDLGIESWALFGILFCWQIPHFLSLAWMYRKDYSRAGFKMLTVTDLDGKKTSRQSMYFTVGLIPATLLLSFLGLTGTIFTITAIVLTGLFLWVGYGFLQSTYHPTDELHINVNRTARKMFFASLVYLPLLMILMSMDKV